MVNFKELKDLISLMKDNDLSEIEVETEGSKIKLKRGDESFLQAAQAPAELPPAPEEPQKPEPVMVQTIKSPMVGTFYASPAPDADPYIKAGTKIEVGQVVCIVEAMKLMNEIKSEIRGTVTEVLIQNGEPVEFGQPMFAVTP